MTSRRFRLAIRRSAGFLWLLAWAVVLYLVAAPWRHLGGLVDERLRWLEWFVLLAGLTVGFAIGRHAREFAGPGTGRTHVGVLRLLMYPMAGLTALGLITLTLLGMRDPVGVVVTAFLAYWAGLDLAFGAVPLMEGKQYRLSRPLDPEPPATKRDDDADGSWIPPWERI
jgi:hypothetical protein